MDSNLGLLLVKLFKTVLCARTNRVGRFNVYQANNNISSLNLDKMNGFIIHKDYDALRRSQQSSDMSGCCRSPLERRSSPTGSIASTQSQSQLTPSRQLSDGERLKKVILELIDTERTYVKHLNNLLENYLEPLRNAPFLSSAEVSALFGNIREIVAFQRLFLQALTEAIEMEPGFSKFDHPYEFKNVLFSIGSAFLYYATQFKLYSSFCASHSKAQKVLHPSEGNQALQEFLMSRNPRQQHSATLESYLIKPIQRILKYPLLLQQLKTLTEPGSDEHRHLLEALKVMEKVAEHINEMQRIHEEYGAIFDHLFRQHQKSCKQAIDLSPGDLLYYGGVEWLNISDFLGKIKKGLELHAMCFVFKTAVVFLCKERLRQKKKLMGGSGKNSSSEVEIIRYQVLIPVTEVQVRASSMKDMDNHFLWELIHLKSQVQRRSEKVYHLSNSTSEFRNAFLKTIRQIIRESVRNMNIPPNKPGPSSGSSGTGGSAGGGIGGGPGSGRMNTNTLQPSRSSGGKKKQPQTQTGSLQRHSGAKYDYDSVESYDNVPETQHHHYQQQPKGHQEHRQEHDQQQQQLQQQQQQQQQLQQQQLQQQQLQQQQQHQQQQQQQKHPQQYYHQSQQQQKHQKQLISQLQNQQKKHTQQNHQQHYMSDQQQEQLQQQQSQQQQQQQQHQQQQHQHQQQQHQMQQVKQSNNQSQHPTKTQPHPLQQQSSSGSFDSDQQQGSLRIRSKTMSDAMDELSDSTTKSDGGREDFGTRSEGEEESSERKHISLGRTPNHLSLSTTSTLSTGSTGSQARLIQASNQPSNYQPVKSLGSPIWKPRENFGSTQSGKSALGSSSTSLSRYGKNRNGRGNAFSINNNDPGGLGNNGDELRLPKTNPAPFSYLGSSTKLQLPFPTSAISKAHSSLDLQQENDYSTRNRTESPDIGNSSMREAHPRYRNTYYSEPSPTNEPNSTILRKEYVREGYLPQMCKAKTITKSNYSEISKSNLSIDKNYVHQFRSMDSRILLKSMSLEPRSSGVKRKQLSYAKEDMLSTSLGTSSETSSTCSSPTQRKTSFVKQGGLPFQLIDNSLIEGSSTLNLSCPILRKVKIDETSHQLFTVDRNQDKLSTRCTENNIHLSRANTKSLDKNFYLDNIIGKLEEIRGNGERALNEGKNIDFKNLFSNVSPPKPPVRSSSYIEKRVSGLYYSPKRLTEFEPLSDLRSERREDTFLDSIDVLNKTAETIDSLVNQLKKF